MIKIMMMMIVINIMIIMVIMITGGSTLTEQMHKFMF